MWPFDRKNQVIFKPSTGEYYTGGGDKPDWHRNKKLAMRFTYTDADTVVHSLNPNGFSLAVISA